MRLPSDLWAMVPAVAQVPLLEQFAALHAENQALQDLWGVRLSLGGVARQEQTQSAALAPAVQAACRAGYAPAPPRGRLGAGR